MSFPKNLALKRTEFEEEAQTNKANIEVERFEHDSSKTNTTFFLHLSVPDIEMEWSIIKWVRSNNFPLRGIGYRRIGRGKLGFISREILFFYLRNFTVTLFNFIY